MLRFIRRSLAAHKIRLILSALAVVLGVAFVAGTFIFTDTLSKTFDDLFAQTTSDVELTPQQAFTTNRAPRDREISIPASLVDRVEALDKLDPALIEAANDLGASAWQTFRKIILPLTLPAVWSGCTMVFLLCCGAFVTPRLLGGPSSQMFGNIISSQFLDAGNWPLGAALSVVLMVVVMLSLYLASRRFGFQSLFMGRH